MAGEKDNNNIVTEVGSASSWGAKERKRFKIPAQATEIDVKRLIGEAWFQFEQLQGAADQWRSHPQNLIAYCRIRRSPQQPLFRYKG